MRRLFFTLISLALPTQALAQEPMGQTAVWGEFALYYTDPSPIYPHGVFGERLEPTRLVDAGAEPYFTRPPQALPQGYVFEDRLPRFVDIEGDGAPEVLTIVTNPRLGAAVWLWGNDGQVRARSEFHGNGYRWLNPMLGSADFDQDGFQDLVIVRTPHIGSRLEILREEGGALVPVFSQDISSLGLSNHLFGDARLNTSLVCDLGGRAYILISRGFQAEVYEFTLDSQSIGLVQQTIPSMYGDRPAILEADMDFINFQGLKESSSCYTF